MLAWIKSVIEDWLRSGGCRHDNISRPFRDRVAGRDYVVCLGCAQRRYLQRNLEA